VEILIPVVASGAAVDCWKPGDLIDYHPDGHSWTVRERTNPNWRIIQVDVLQTTLDALADQPVPQLGVTKRVRERGLNLSLLPDPSLFIGARTQEIISLTRKQCTDAIVKKP